MATINRAALLEYLKAHPNDTNPAGVFEHLGIPFSPREWNEWIDSHPEAVERAGYAKVLL